MSPRSRTFPALTFDSLEWDDFPNERRLAVIVAAEAALLPGLGDVREALRKLPVVQHPDHYLHVTLRELGAAGTVDDASLDAITDMIAATPAWEAKVRGVRAFPTAIWLDPDSDGRMLAIMDKLMAEIGNLPAHPYRPRAVGHLTVAYSQGELAAEDVGEVLTPLADFEIGRIEMREAILAELHFTEAYPHWTVVRRFPFG